MKSHAQYIIFVWIILSFQEIQASIHLWASEVTKFSTQYKNEGYFAKQVLGKPNVYPRYGNIAGTWTQAAGQLDRVHFIEVKFPRKIFITKVNIYETFNAGAVVKISAKDGQNQWVDIFNVTNAHVIRKSRKFSPQIKRIMFPVDELRIEVDCSVSRHYVEIDAIEIVGYMCPSPFFQYGNSCYLIKKDTVSGDEAFAKCLRIGGYLANMETLEEAMLIKYKLMKMKTESQASIQFWASEVTKFSNQYNTGGYSANQVLGKPDVYPKYGDSVNTWTQSSNQLDRVHFIEVKFPRKIFLTKVNIYETYHAGAVVKISAKDEDNHWVVIYNVTHAHVIRKARKFSPPIKRIMFPVDELRIEVDCLASKGYVEIDAIEIVGDMCPLPFFKYRSSCYFIKKDAVSGDEAFARCLQIGGYLANFETLEETMLMKDKLKKMKTGISYYVGGRNINSKKPGGDWRWIKHGTMTKMTYFVFSKGEPSGTEQSPENCMIFLAGDRYKIHDVFCDNGYNLGGYICEI